MTASVKKVFLNAEQIDLDDTQWQTVTVPHGWSSYELFNKKKDKQNVKIIQNGEKVATEKKEEQVLCIILVVLGIEEALL